MTGAGLTHRAVVGAGREGFPVDDHVDVRPPASVTGHPGQQFEGRRRRQTRRLVGAALIGEAGEVAFDRVDYRLVAFGIELGVDRSHTGPFVEPMAPRAGRLLPSGVGEAVVALDPLGLTTNPGGEHVGRVGAGRIDELVGVQPLPLLGTQIAAGSGDGIDLLAAYLAPVHGPAHLAQLGGRPRSRHLPASRGASNPAAVAEQGLVRIRIAASAVRPTADQPHTDPHQQGLDRRLAIACTSVSAGADHPTSTQPHRRRRPMPTTTSRHPTPP